MIEMTSRPRTLLIAGVLTCFLVTGGVVLNQAAAHSFHHTHHNAATHSHILCSLLCATGQVVHVAEPCLDTTFHVLRFVNISLFEPAALAAPMPRFSRGPPVL